MPTSATLDLDTFLTAVYVVIDDLYCTLAQPLLPPRPGARPLLSDSEVLTLMALGQWQAPASERAFLRFVRAHWSGYFPHLPSQSAFNRRGRQVGGILAYLGPRVRQQVDTLLGPSAYEVLDGVPVPLMRRCRGRQQRLFGDEAGVGRGGTDKQWYYGVRLLAAVDQAGFITGWVEGPASTGERWEAEALFRWRQNPYAVEPTAQELAPILGPGHHRAKGERLGPTGPIRGRLSAGPPPEGPILADLGFTGAAWRHHWATAYGARVLIKDDYLPGPHQRPAVRRFNGLRQQVETTFSILEHTFSLWHPGARTHWAVLTRLAAKVTAYNLGMAINYQFHRAPHAIFNPLHA